MSVTIICLVNIVENSAAKEYYLKKTHGKTYLVLRNKQKAKHLKKGKNRTSYFKMIEKRLIKKNKRKAKKRKLSIEKAIGKFGKDFGKQIAGYPNWLIKNKIRAAVSFGIGTAGGIDAGINHVKAKNYDVFENKSKFKGYCDQRDMQIKSEKDMNKKLQKAFEQFKPLSTQLSDKLKENLKSIKNGECKKKILDSLTVRQSSLNTHVEKILEKKKAGIIGK